MGSWPMMRREARGLPYLRLADVDRRDVNIKLLAMALGLIAFPLVVQVFDEWRSLFERAR